MHIAATLSGDAPNQDRYIVGEGFAAVLDGSTSVAGDRSHDPGWYAEQLGEALQHLLPGDESVAEAVRRAIAQVQDSAGLVAETSPTSTVAVARWNDNDVETYTLCDSTVVILNSDGSERAHTDDRAAEAVAEHRAAYKAHLEAGHGYDERLREILLALQKELARRRNQPDGYWVAGADPAAALHGKVRAYKRSDVDGVILATDGVALERHPWVATWRGLYAEARRHGADSLLRDLYSAEKDDSDGVRWWRSKRHDDKTLVVVPLR
ncbi:protein phosphatase 2C domain-containing protein [Myceligenerans cantabricum]